MLPDKPWHQPLPALACRQTDPRQVAMLVQGLLQRFPGAQVRAVLEEPLPGSMNGKFSWYRSVPLQQRCKLRVCNVMPLSLLLQGKLCCEAACNAAHSAALHCRNDLHHVVPLAADVHGGDAMTAAGGLCMAVPGIGEACSCHHCHQNPQHCSFLPSSLGLNKAAGQPGAAGGTNLTSRCLSKAVEPTAECPCPAARATPLASGRAFCCPAACPLPQ